MEADYDIFWSKAFDNMDDFIFIVDRDFYIVKSNKSLLKFLGANCEKLKNNKCFELIHGCSIAIKNCPHRMLLRTKKFQDEEFFEKHLKKWLSVRVTPIFDKQGRLLGSIHIVSDVTNLRKMHDKIKWLACFPEMNPNPVIEVDIKGNITYANPAAKKKLAFLFNKHPDRMIIDSIGKAYDVFKKGKKKFLTSEIVVKDSVYQQHMSYVKDTKHIRVYLFDITQQKQVDSLKDELISTVSHELRTPLSIIREAISLVLDNVLGVITQPQRDTLGIALDNIDRLSKLVSNLLDVSKIESAKMEIKKQEVDVSKLLSLVVSLFQRKAREKNIVLKSKIPVLTRKMSMDEEKIIRVFSILINNALRFTNCGQIEVSALQAKNCVRFSVKDTGVGISKKDLPNVFKKFQQFNRVAGPGYAGAGLELVVAKGLVELHGGKIGVNSELGIGTEIFFTLPFKCEKVNQK